MWEANFVQVYSRRSCCVVSLWCSYVESVWPSPAQRFLGVGAHIAGHAFYVRCGTKRACMLCNPVTSRNFWCIPCRASVRTALARPADQPNKLAPLTVSPSKKTRCISLSTQIVLIHCYELVVDDFNAELWGRVCDGRVGELCARYQPFGLMR